MEKNHLRLLLIDSDQNAPCLIRDSLHRSGVLTELRVHQKTDKALKRLRPGDYDLILSDHQPPEVSAVRLLRTLRERGIETPVVLITRDGAFHTARELFKLGAGDYLLKEELEAVSLLDVVSSLLERQRQATSSREFQQHLKEQAVRDGLTGLFNHRHFLEVLEKEYFRSRRYRRPLTLLMVDLDGFKSINDNCGHPKGDLVLSRVAKLLKDSVRGVDAVARYGGDEFALLLPETLPEDGMRIAERLRGEISGMPFLDGEKIYPLSASIGLASTGPSITGPGMLLAEADRALYLAKRSGRNRVIEIRSGSTAVSDECSKTHSEVESRLT